MKVIAVPSLESTEEMRTPVIEDLMGTFAPENRPNLAGTESKIQLQHRPFVGVSPNRTPFPDVN